MANSMFRSTYRLPTDGRTNSTSPASQKPAECKVTFDEIQEMAGNGKLGKFLDDLGFPAAPPKVSKLVKRRMGEGASFDRETFSQATYDKHLLKGGK